MEPFISTERWLLKHVVQCIRALSPNKTFTFPQKINALKIKWLIMPITDQKSSFLTLLLKSIRDWNIRLLRFVLSWFLFNGMVRNGIPRVYFYFLLHRKEFRIVFSSAECFGTKFREFASILVPRNGNPSCVLFHRRVRNRIMGVCFYFCCTERNSELFSLPRKGSERNT